MTPPIHTHLDSQFGFLVSDVARLLREHFNGTAEALGLTLAQARVLMQLARNEGTSQVALAGLLEIAPITLLRQIDRLADMQLVERRPNPRDRRAQQIYLTKKGGSLIEQIWQLSESLREEALSGLSAESREQLVGALQRIKANLGAAPDASVSSAPASAAGKPDPKGHLRV